MSLNSTTYYTSSSSSSSLSAVQSAGTGGSGYGTYIAVTVVIGVASFVVFASLALLIMDRRNKYRERMNARQQKLRDDPSSDNSEILPRGILEQNSDEEYFSSTSSIETPDTLENAIVRQRSSVYSFFVPSEQSHSSLSTVEVITSMNEDPYTSDDTPKKCPTETVSLESSDDNSLQVPIIIALRNMAVSFMCSENDCYAPSFSVGLEDISSCSTDSCPSSSFDSTTQTKSYGSQTTNHSNSNKIDDPTLLSSLSGSRSSMISTLERLECLVANIRAVQLRNQSNPRVDELSLKGGPITDCVETAVI